jgi:hypothetical protein
VNKYEHAGVEEDHETRAYRKKSVQPQTDDKAKSKKKRSFDSENVYLNLTGTYMGDVVLVRQGG